MFILFLGANPLYSVEWYFVGTVLIFNCKLACRTSIIKGCEVSLLKETETISMQSEPLDRASERISGREYTVVFLGISLNKSVNYRAIALTNSNITEFGEEFAGSVSRNCKFFTYMLATALTDTEFGVEFVGRVGVHCKFFGVP